MTGRARRMDFISAKQMLIQYRGKKEVVEQPV
jgi:hypothetical protein